MEIFPNNTELHLRCEGKNYTESFRIVKSLKTGGSVRVYRVEYGNVPFIMRQFIGCYSEHIYHDEHGALTCKPGYSLSQFLAEQQVYYNQQKAVQHIKKSEDTDPFYFIPDILFYDSPDANGNHQLFLISKEPELNVYSNLIREAHQAKGESDLSLCSLLQCTEALCMCLNVMHAKGLIHGDIKPANFGFLKGAEGRTLFDTIQLFDTNTVFSIQDPLAKLMEWYSFGYSEPSKRRFRTGNVRDIQSDVYSVGATLYNALTNQIYQPTSNWRGETFSEIAESPLLRKLSPKFKKYKQKIAEHLTRAVRLAVAPDNFRYRDLNPLCEEIHAVIFLLMQVTETRKSSYTSDDRKKAVEYLLGTHPLYTSDTDNRGDWKILVVGSSPYAEDFLDYALQLGQTCEGNFSVTLLDTNDTFFCSYLEKRPYIRKFFTVSGDKPEVMQSYGEINFCSWNHVTETMLNEYRYIFIGDASQPQQIADSFCTLKAEVIAVAPSADAAKVILPHDDARYVLLDETAKQDSAYIEMLERIARNTHWIWADHSLPYADILKDYKNPYNADSSLHNAFSLQYKLHALGLTLSPEQTAEVANAYAEMLDEEIVERLRMMEKRRWNAEFICQGYVQLTDIEKAAEQGRKIGKQHMCLVESYPTEAVRKKGKQLLSDYPVQQWDTLDETELFDPMDIISLRYYHKKRAYFARLLAEDMGEIGVQLYALSVGLPNNSAERELFCIWENAVKKTMSGDAPCIKSCLQLTKRVEALVKAKNDPELNMKFRYLGTRIKQCQEAYVQKDYREIDRDMAYNIPYLLLFDDSVKLVVPLGELHSAKQQFSAVESVLALEPSEVIYLSVLRSQEEINLLRTWVQRVQKLFAGQCLRTKIKLRICCTENLEQELQADSVISRNAAIWTACDLYEAVEKFVNSLQRTKNILVQETAAQLTGALMQQTGGSLPMFRFDAVRQQFYASTNEKNPPAAVAAALEMRPYTQTVRYDFFNIAEFFDVRPQPAEPPFQAERYQTVFELFSKYVSIWKAVSFANNKSFYMRFDFQEHSDAMTTVEIPRISERMKPMFRYLVGQLKQYGIVTECEFRSVGGFFRTDVEYCATITTKNIWANNVNNLFSHNLDEESSIQFDLHDDVLYVRCIKLIARFNLNKSVAELQVLQQFIGDLRKNNLLRDGYAVIDRSDSEKYFLSLSFTSATALDLVWTAGAPLEQKLYYDLLLSGKVCNVELNTTLYWNDRLSESKFSNDAKNELDLVGVSKNGRVFLIECKARDLTIENVDICYKLSAIAHNLNANTVPILAVYDPKLNTEKHPLQTVCNAFGIHLMLLNDVNIGTFPDQLLSVLGEA